MLEKKQIPPPAIIPKLKSIAMGKYGATGLTETGQFVNNNISSANVNNPNNFPNKKHSSSDYAQTYEINDLLINNGRKAWLIGETTEDLNGSIDDPSLASSPCRSNASNRNYFYERRQHLHPHLQENSADVVVDEEVKLFYKVTTELQDLFADWYFVSPNVIEDECKAQLASRYEKR